MSCYICLEDLNLPVSLPCGHVFCHDCLRRAVEAVQPYSTLHACPTCRSHYHLAPLDTSAVPHHLRSHLAPSIRKIYIGPPSPKNQTPNTSKSQSHTSAEIARLRAENEALRHNCSLWRKRAEAHSAMTLGLLQLSQIAQDQTLQVAQERDTIYKDYLRLNRDFQQQQAVMQTMVTTPPQKMPGSTSQLNLLVPETNFGGASQIVNACVSACLGHNSSSPIAKPPSRKRLRTECEDEDGAANTIPDSSASRGMTKVGTASSSGSDVTHITLLST